MHKDEKKSWSHLVDRYVLFCFKHPFTILAGFALLAAAGTWFAMGNLRIVTDLAALLPQGTTSVEALNESKERIGSTDFFTIAIQSESGNRKAIAAAQDLLKERIEKDWDDASWVQVDRDTDFFREHALYYLPEETLIDLKSRLEEELIRASADALPGMVNLLDDRSENGSADSSASNRIEDWYDEDLPQRLGLPSQVAEEFHSFFKKNDTSHARAPNETAPPSNRLIGPEGKVGVVLVQLTKPSTDLDYAQFALRRGESLILDIEPETIAPDLNAQVVGAYRSFMEVDAVAGDGKIATAVSVSLVLVLLMLFFRSPRAVFAVITPLAVASALTMGLTALIYGRLTVLTVFVLAMLIGLGIDYGIHLFGRTLNEYRKSNDLCAATQASIRDTGSALAIAALTSIAALLTLLLGHFEGFKEFGVVASYGLLLSVVCTILIVPPMIALMDRVVSQRRSPASRSILHFFAARFSVRTCVPVAFCIGLITTFTLVWFAPQVRFEHDFRNLRAERTGTSIKYGRAVGKSAGTAPAVILGKSRRQMRESHEYLLERTRSGQAPEVGSFITLYTFVPAVEEQKKRRTVINEIGAIANKRAMRRLRGENGRLVDELRTMAAAEPFGEKDLPDWARRIVAEQDGRVGLIGHMYTKIEDWNANAVRDFKLDYGSLRFAGEPLSIACSGFILSDVVESVKADGGRLLLSVSIALLLILALFTRSIRATLILSGVIATGAVWTVGAMGMFDIRIGLYNLIVIPVILGVGIDCAIHLYHRHRTTGSTGIGENLKTTGVTVTASSFTTMAGFAGLLFVGHKGLQTIGVLACLGVGLAWLSVMLLLPFLLTNLLAPKRMDTAPSAIERVRSDRVERGCFLNTR